MDVVTLNAALEVVESMKIGEYGDWGSGYDAAIDDAINAIKSLYPEVSFTRHHTDCDYYQSSIAVQDLYAHPWVIALDGGVCDRYLTEEQAYRYILDYSEGATVEYQPEEIHPCNLSCGEWDDGSDDYQEVEV